MLQRPAHPAPLTLNTRPYYPAASCPAPSCPAPKLPSCPAPSWQLLTVVSMMTQLSRAKNSAPPHTVTPHWLWSCTVVQTAVKGHPPTQGAVQGHPPTQYRVIHQHRVSSHLSLAGDGGQQAGLAGVGEVELHRGGGVATPRDQDACNNGEYNIIQASSYIGVPFPECTMVLETLMLIWEQRKW